MKPLHPPRTSPRRPRLQRPRARGVVLVVALALLVFIAFISSMIMRNALFGDLIAGNIKESQTAQYAADVALRYCEGLLQVTPRSAALTVNPAPATGNPILWQTAANWDNPAVTTAVPANVYQSAANNNSAGVTMNFNRAPACIIESMELRPTTLGSPTTKIEVPSAIFQITARGFGADYRAAAPGVAGVGSEVLLQSTVRLFCSTTSWYVALCK